MTHSTLLTKVPLIDEMCKKHNFYRKGIGTLYGIETLNGEIAAQVQKFCFDNKLIIELCGSTDSVVKILPPLTISENEIREGFEVVDAALTYSVNN